jgi:hypothetical protein
VAEIYVSTDVETDGPIPGPHSMLSLASAAFLPDGTLVDSFSANLAQLDGAAGHPDRSPFSHSALDIKTYAMAMLRKEYRASSKKAMPKHWLPSRPHTHVALDDAIEQGELFCRMLAENLRAGDR